MRQVSGVLLPTALAIVAATALLTSASAAPLASADLQVLVSARLERAASIPPLFSDGATTTVARRSFLLGLGVLNGGPDSAMVRARFVLPPGLDWGPDGPDPSESCTESQAPICEVALGNTPTTDAQGWEWDVVAGATGSYVVRVEVVESSASDPNPANDSASVTIVVADPPSPPPAEPARPSVGAARLRPTRPKAGARVSATVRVTAGGTAIRPTGVLCTGTAGRTTVRGTPRSALGSASCTYRPPASTRGQTLRGAVSFTARGTRFTRRFSARLG